MNIQKLLIVGIVCCIGLSLTSVGFVAADSHHGDEFIVELETDGDAEVTIVTTYELNSDDERDAFESLSNDEAAQNDLTERFHERMQSVASTANGDVDREMEVTDPSVETWTEDDIGYVALSVTWGNFAETNGGSLTVEQPFTDGYTVDGTLSIESPEGYELESTTHNPDVQTNNVYQWNDGTDLNGFEIVFESSSETGTDGGVSTSVIIGGLLVAVGIVGGIIVFASEKF